MKKIGSVSSKSEGLVFVDVSNDRLLDSWEARATTRGNGSFLIEADKAALSGTLVHIGGIDLYGGFSNSIYYQAPAGARVLNNLTSIVTGLQADLTDIAIAKQAASGASSSTPKVSYAQAELKLISALKIKSWSILKEDAFALLSGGKLKDGSARQLKALDALGADLKFELLFDLGLSVLKSLVLEGADLVVAQGGMISAMSGKVAAGQKIDFGEVSHTVDAIVAGGLDAGIFTQSTEPAAFIDSMSALIVGMMQQVDAWVGGVAAKGKGIVAADVDGLLGDISTLFSVAGSAAVDIERAWYSSSGQDVLGRYTGAGLQQLLAAGTADANEVVGNFGRDVFSMTSGKDTWVVKVDPLSGDSYSYPNAEMDRYDEILNFSVQEDKLDLPYSSVMTPGIYGELQVGAHGVVTNIVWDDVETAIDSGITPMSFEDAVQSLLDSMGAQRVSVAFHKAGDTYVVQGDGTAGMQKSDILVKLTGVLIEDLSSILV